MYKVHNKRQRAHIDLSLRVTTRGDLNRFISRRRHTFLLEHTLSAELSLFPLFENSTVPTGKKSALYNPCFCKRSLWSDA